MSHEPCIWDSPRMELSFVLQEQMRNSSFGGSSEQVRLRRKLWNSPHPFHLLDAFDNRLFVHKHETSVICSDTPIQKQQKEKCYRSLEWSLTPINRRESILPRYSGCSCYPSAECSRTYEDELTEQTTHLL